MDNRNKLSHHWCPLFFAKRQALCEGNLFEEESRCWCRNIFHNVTKCDFILDCSMNEMNRKECSREKGRPWKIRKTRELLALQCGKKRLYQSKNIVNGVVLLTLKTAHERVWASFSLCMLGSIVQVTIITQREKALLENFDDDDWSFRCFGWHDTAQPHLRPFISPCANRERGPYRNVAIVDGFRKQRRTWTMARWCRSWTGDR